MNALEHSQNGLNPSSNGKPLQLSVDEIEYVVSMFARGNPRKDVVKSLIREFPDRYPDDAVEFRNKLSDHLRKYDPSSKGFAEKYYAMLNMHQQEIQDAMGALYTQQYESLRDNILLRVDRQAESLANIDRKIEMLDDMWWKVSLSVERQTSENWVRLEHKRLIEIDKQMQKWHEIRRKEEEHLAKLFFALKDFEMKMFERIPQLKKNNECRATQRDPRRTSYRHAKRDFFALFYFISLTTRRENTCQTDF